MYYHIPTPSGFPVAANRVGGRDSRHADVRVEARKYYRADVGRNRGIGPKSRSQNRVPLLRAPAAEDCRGGSGISLTADTRTFGRYRIPRPRTIFLAVPG